MALNTVSSDRLSTNVKNTNFTAAEKQDLTDDIKPLLGSSGGGNKNLIINGAMNVAQRGTSSTTSGYGSVDRFEVKYAGTDEAPTHAQAAVASGTTPYTSGFRKSLKITNGNQTSGAGAADELFIRYKIEAQDLRTSGWNYTSSSSNITLQFWIKSSVAQNFYGYLRTRDGTGQRYAFETGSLSADTWTKVTKTIPGNSNLQLDRDDIEGMQIALIAFFGTDLTDSGVSLNAWGAYSSSTSTPDNTSTWYTTNDSTLEITGVQLELGSVATDFEHRSFHDDLLKCQRYFYVHCEGLNKSIGNGTYWTANNVFCPVHFPVTMRSGPSMTVANDTINNWYGWFRDGTGNYEKGDNWSLAISGVQGAEIYDPAASGTAGHSCFGRSQDASAKITFSAEL